MRHHRRGVMTPPEQGKSRHLMSVDSKSFASFDLHLEIKRLFWCGAGVLALVLWLLTARG